MQTNFEKKLAMAFTQPVAGIVIVLVCTFALSSVFIAQYIFNLRPCVLCLWQRVPFFVAPVFAILALIIRPYYPASRYLLGLCAMTFLVGTGLAIFHSGVEMHWWLGTSGCSIHPTAHSDAQSLRAALLQTPIARCDEVTWRLLGFSMANWNVPFSFCMTIFSALSALIYVGERR